MSKHNLWVECEEHKKSLKLWNDELLKNQEFKCQPQHVVKLDEGIRTLKTTLSKFVNRIDNLKKLLGYYKISLDKSGNGYNGKVYVHDENTIVCFFYGKTRHMTSRCRDRSKKGSPNPFMANTKGPKKIWIPKKKVIPIADVLDTKKKTPIMVPRQWLLTPYDRRKVYVLMPDSLSWWNSRVRRETER